MIYGESVFHMWYGGEDAQGIVRGGYATSPDGITWGKYPGNPVFDVGPPGSWDSGHARPGAVVLDGDTYRMWYSGWGYQYYGAIGFAESTDGINWTKWLYPVLDGASPPAWDVEVFNPTVVFDGFVYHLLYGGYDRSGGDWMVGYAFSGNPIAFRRHLDKSVMSVDGEDVYVLPVVFDGSTWHGWYTSLSLPASAVSITPPPPAALASSETISRPVTPPGGQQRCRSSVGGEWRRCWCYESTVKEKTNGHH